MIDTHCHINFHAYDEDRLQVMERAFTAGVRRVINPAIDVSSTREAIALAREHPGFYASAGVHPNSTVDFTDELLADIKRLAENPEVVAIGEIGLDYHWDKSPKHQQIKAFEAQLHLAATLQMPIIIHNREASDDVLAILEAWVPTLPDSLRTRPGVLHSFSAPPEIAERALNIGFYLGFTGPITYKNADELRRIAASVPMDRILTETDGPFLTPVPHRGNRNEPAYIPIIVERLATLKQVSNEEMAEATWKNAEILFGI